MTADAGTMSCANCGRAHAAADIDPAGWCTGCRRVVVRRATLVAHVLAATAALLAASWVLLVVEPERFVLVWALLVALVYLVLYKLTRRVAFEVIRNRGVPPPEIP